MFLILTQAFCPCKISPSPSKTPTWTKIFFIFFALFLICLSVCVCVCMDRLRLCGLRQPRGSPEGCGLAQSQRSPGADGEGKRRFVPSALCVLLLVSPRCFPTTSPPLFSSVALATSLQGGWDDQQQVEGGWASMLWVRVWTQCFWLLLNNWWGTKSGSFPVCCFGF